MESDKHEELIRDGLVLHEDRQYERALPFFEKARLSCPACPNAAYNMANTLHMLGDHGQAREILLELVNSSDDLLSGCTDLADSPRSLRLDAFHLLFLATLEETGSWRQAAPFLRKHLRQRTRGLRSLWSKAEIVRDAEKLRLSYSPRATSVSTWNT
jgi:tetratricopeptide (TPR) repeat protein